MAPASKTAKKTAAKTGKSTAKTTVKTTRPAPRRRTTPEDIPILARRTTNRQGLREQDAGKPPEGPITEAALNKMIKAWKARPNKRPSEYCRYPGDRIIRDAKEMCRGREDLPLFASKRTPITVRDFDWMEMLTKRVEELMDSPSLSAGTTEVVDENTQLAMRNVVDARSTLGRRAEACGVPLAYFKFGRVYREPVALLSAANRVARNARRVLDSFNDREYAEQLITALEEAAEALDTLVVAKEDVRAGDRESQGDTAAVKRFLYDCLTYVAPWGRDITAGDPDKAGRYELDHIFPTKPTKDDPEPTPNPG